LGRAGRDEVTVPIEFLKPDRPLRRVQSGVEEYADWDGIPAPYPASRDLPDWYRNMPGTAELPGVLTVKRCPPFLDGMGAGYLIPFPDQVMVRLTAPYEWQKSGPGGIFLGYHYPQQYPGAWWSDHAIVKFDSPWIIRTPPGYSTLFLPPVNRPPGPFLPLSGIVDTDAFYNAVAFPMVLVDRSVGAVHAIEKGRPMVQAIPFRREEWAMSAGTSDHEAWVATQKAVKEDGPGYYRDRVHHKKRFD
jgi:hypothetical protein